MGACWLQAAGGARDGHGSSTQRSGVMLRAASGNLDVFYKQVQSKGFNLQSLQRSGYRNPRRFRLEISASFPPRSCGRARCNASAAEELWVLRLGARHVVHLPAAPPLTWCPALRPPPPVSSLCRPPDASMTVAKRKCESSRKQRNRAIRLSSRCPEGLALSEATDFLDAEGDPE